MPLIYTSSCFLFYTHDGPKTTHFLSVRNAIEYLHIVGEDSRVSNDGYNTRISLCIGL